MKVEVAVLGSPSLIVRWMGALELLFIVIISSYGRYGRKATLNDDL